MLLIDPRLIERRLRLRQLRLRRLQLRCRAVHGHSCGVEVAGQALAFSAAKGGALCERCQAGQRDRLPLPPPLHEALLMLREGQSAWKSLTDAGRRGEVRRLLNDYVTYVLGRRPRLLPYLGS